MKGAILARGRLGAAALTAAVTIACTPIAENHGYTPPQSALSAIAVGVDTRATVRDRIGPPTMGGVTSDNAWYYVSSRWRTVAFRAPKIVDREVIAISFDDDGTVSNIERFTLEDGRVILINRRVTEDSVQGTSFLRQLLGDIGNFTTGQILGEDEAGP